MSSQLRQKFCLTLFVYFILFVTGLVLSLLCIVLRFLLNLLPSCNLILQYLTDLEEVYFYAEIPGIEIKKNERYKFRVKADFFLIAKL